MAFLYYSEDVSALGFTVIVDMRGNTTWNSVKPILKVLQEYFAAHIHTAHIIKPDNFWQKQRTSLGSQKYKFEVSTDFAPFCISCPQTFQNQYPMT